MDELIRKQDALDAFNGNVTISAARNAGRVYTYLKMVTDRIKALPPVQPEILACGEGELNVPDTNVHSNSALDHIYNVVRDDAYRRGYEQGKADAKAEAIPVDWIESYLSYCEVGSIVYLVIKQMLYKWREEREGEQRETD